MILTYAEQQNLRFLLHGGPFIATIDQLPDELELREIDLPTPAAWAEARQRAGQIFGLPLLELRTASNVSDAAKALKEKASEQRPSAADLTVRLRSILEARNLSVSGSRRGQTAVAAHELVAALDQATTDRAIEGLVTARVVTSAAAMAKSLSTARDTASSFQHTRWSVVDAALSLGDWEELIGGGRRVLVVQRTGWGKSLVYFVATRLLRERGRGPTILISPLLSLMRNQVEMANRLGVRAVRVDSTNQAEWTSAERDLAADGIDLLMVSPERLSNDRFRTTTVPAIARGIGLFVVDEAHCISDWGHDFRPDYRRIAAFIRTLPPAVPLLATTATANARVIEDIQAQLGGDCRHHFWPARS